MKKNPQISFLKYLLMGLPMMVILLVSCKKSVSPYQDAQVRPTEIFNGSVLEYLESKKGVYDSMVTVIKRFPGLVSKLNSDDSMTVFAIPNTAFEVAEKNFNLERSRVDSPFLYFKPAVYNLARADSGMYHFETLQTLIARYLFNGIHDYDELVKSTSGFPMSSILGYEMNLKAIQENSVGSLKDGPKVIELSDMNNSIFRRFWKSVTTTSIGSVKAKNTLIHTLTQNHEFGFASFTEKLQDPTIDRGAWTPIAWHSQHLGAWGGTVFHALDGNLNTRWHTPTSNAPPGPFFFTVDMKKNTLIGGVTIQVRRDGSHDGSPVDFTLEFAKDGALLTDSASWTKLRFSYPPDPSTVKLPKRFNFSEKVTARYFRFVVNQSFSGRLWTDRPYTNLDEIWMNY